MRRLDTGGCAARHTAGIGNHQRDLQLGGGHIEAAVRDRMIPFSPCVDIRLPHKKPANLLQVLTTDQVLDLAEAVPDRYHHLIVAECGMGLRPGELFGLTVDRVDFLKRTVRIDQQLVRDRTDGGVKLSNKLKTRTSYRTLPLASMVADALAAHLDLYGPHPDLGVIFTNEWGGPVQQYPFGMMFENAPCGRAYRSGRGATRSRRPPRTICAITTPAC